MSSGLPLHGVLGHQPFVRSDLGRDVQRGVHVHIDVLAHPRRIPVHHGGQRRHGGMDAGDVRRLTPQAAHRRQGMVVVAAVPHRPAPGHQREVGSGVLGPWPFLTEGRHGHPDQRGRGGHDAVPVDAAGDQVPRLLGLQDDVGPGHEPMQQLDSHRGVEVEHDTVLRSVMVPPPEAPLGTRSVVQKGADGAGGVPSRRFDQRDLGTEVRQQLARPGRMLAGQLHHLETVERAASLPRRGGHGRLGERRRPIRGLPSRPDRPAHRA